MRSEDFALDQSHPSVLKRLFRTVFLARSLPLINLACPLTNSSFGAALSPKAGLNVQDTDVWRIRASHGRGFRASDLDHFSIRFTDWPQSHGGSEKYLETSVALCLCGKNRTPK